MSTPSSPNSPRQADHNQVAEAALKRLTQSVNPGDSDELRYEHERPVRQKFRRLVDPGIVRDNSEADAKRALGVLLKLSENLLSDPENPKFREFKSTNNAIKRALIEPKGAIEFAIELGFRATIEEFQPKYVWHSSPENLTALRVGRDVLKDHIELATAKEERTNLSQQMAKAHKTAAVQNALLAFEDDRKRRKALDERMKRDGYPTTPVKAPTATVPPASPVFSIQGEGQTLGTPSTRRGFVHEGEDTTVADD
ncbi:hypothetical protein RSOLAG22IIIB_00540 [Rhizoctonia solani]|uniref:PUB domain-containing protein n=1 Tax=Rhizoctonia solani TaxID=456999 RepID=A0A0K6FV87_9AGAM|nr:hypothetical protein RSOLAG22IIIB_00540 [Rhizoctonia solani]